MKITTPWLWLGAAAKVWGAEFKAPPGALTNHYLHRVGCVNPLHTDDANCIHFCGFLVVSQLPARSQWIYTGTKTQHARDTTSLACAPAYFIGGALRWGVFQPPGTNWRKGSPLSLLWQRLERCRDSLQPGIHYYENTKHARHYATQLLAAFPQIIWDDVDDKTKQQKHPL